MQIQFTTIADEDVESFRECLDVVARERKYLALWKHHQSKRSRVRRREHRARRAAGRRTRRPSGSGLVRYSALVASHTASLCALGMGSLAGYRGRGLGNVFLGAGLERAVQAGVARVELKAREDNLRALAL